MKFAAVALVLVSAFVAAGEATDTYAGLWECRNQPIQKAAYFSAIFDGKADRGEVQRAFTQMLATKYGYKGQVGCGVATSRSPEMLAKLKDDQARYMKQLQLSKIKVVKTGWTFAGASAAAPKPAPAIAPVAPAATAPQGPTKLWVCRGNANAPSRDMYITKPFAAGYDLTTQRKMYPALAKYMQAHYQPTSMMCEALATQAEADARVAWLVNFAHTNHFDYVSVPFTYP